MFIAVEGRPSTWTARHYMCAATEILVIFPFSHIPRPSRLFRADCDVICDVVARGCSSWVRFTAWAARSASFPRCVARLAHHHQLLNTSWGGCTCCSHGRAEPSTGSINHTTVCASSSVSDTLVASTGGGLWTTMKQLRNNGAVTSPSHGV